MLDGGTNVTVGHDDLKLNPAENANSILAHHNRGLLAWLGGNGCAGAVYAPSIFPLRLCF